MEYKLITLDGTLELDDTAGTIRMGTEAARPVAGATAVVETAGELNRRITASRIVLTGVFALAWKKKQDDRELYLTVQTSETTMLARVDPKRGDATRRFSAAVNDVGAGRAVPEASRAVLARKPIAANAAERKVVEQEKVARMTPDEKAAYDRKNAIIGGIMLLVIVIFVIYVYNR